MLERSSVLKTKLNETSEQFVDEQTSEHFDTWTHLKSDLETQLRLFQTVFYVWEQFQKNYILFEKQLHDFDHQIDQITFDRKSESQLLETKLLIKVMALF